MSTVLLSGGLSNLSNALAQQLIDNGDKVILLNNYSDNSKKLFKSLENHDKFELLNIDSVNEEAIIRVINDKKVSKVIDCSLQSKLVELNPLEGASRLLLGITSLLDAIRTSSTPISSFVLVSGEQVYGTTTIRDETRPLEPITFIGSAQMSVEAMVHSYAVSYRIPTVIARIPNLVYVDAKQFDDEVKELDDGCWVNVLDMADTVTGIIGLAGLKEFDEPADVYNVSNGAELLVGDIKKKTGAIATRQATFTNAKLLLKNIGFVPDAKFIQNYLTESVAPQSIDISPMFLIYGDSFEKREFVKLLENENVPYKLSQIELSTSGDKPIYTEINDILPTHLIYFSTNTNNYEGDCFVLRTNMSINLYIPWILSSIADKYQLHLTYFDKESMAQSSAQSVKCHTDKMIRKFDNTLRLRYGPIVSAKKDGEENLLEVLEVATAGEEETSISVLEDCLPRSLRLIMEKKTGIIDSVNPGHITFKKIAELIGERKSNGNNNSQQQLTPSKMCSTTFEETTTPIGCDIQESVKKCVEQLYSN